MYSYIRYGPTGTSVGEAPLPYFKLKYIFLDAEKVLKKEGCHFTIFENLVSNGKKTPFMGVYKISVYTIRWCKIVFEL